MKKGVMISMFVLYYLKIMPTYLISIFYKTQPNLIDKQINKNNNIMFNIKIIRHYDITLTLSYTVLKN